MSAARVAAVELVARRVGEADPDLAPEAVTGAIAVVATNGAVLRDLARALQPGPDALHAGAPPSVGRLVVELRTRGSTLAKPSCVRCERSDRPLTASAEGGVCSRCRRRQTATACRRCGGVKPVAGRDEAGGALCAACAPRPRRLCADCGLVRIIARRARDGHGDLCDRCYLGPMARCGTCGRTKPCNFVAQGRPICRSCSPRRQMACAHCGQSRPPCANWPEGPVCEPCYRAALARRGLCVGCGSERRLVSPPGSAATHCASCAGVTSLATCRSCGVEERPYANGRCARCALAERARRLVGPAGGPLEPVYTSIVTAPQPYSAHNWLRASAGARILAELVSQGEAVTHEALDTYPRQASDFLRHLLVANGVLAPRDEGLVRLEDWIRAKLATIDDADRRRLLRSYATWRLLRRARRRSTASQRPHTPIAHTKACLNAAVAFLAFLDERDRDLAACSQADVDAWASEGIPSASAVSDFLDWALERRLLAPVVLARRAQRQGTALDDDTRWSTLQRLLHDEHLELTDRVAGCLVLAYGQQLSRIVAITRDQLNITDDLVGLNLGATAVEIPDPLRGLLTRLATGGRRHTGVGSPPDTPWLFPGLSPGRPLSAAHLGERLRRLGIPTMASRRGALIHLGAQLPAAVLADLLGITASTAVRWVRTAGGDWSNYAAQVVKERRSRTVSNSH